jgi:phage tail sheath protein FI
MTYSRPGVYVSERDLPTPVTNIGTANAAGACIGYFQKGPEAVTRVVSWYDFASSFGDLNPLYPATYGVNQFFQNGGNELYVRRVTSGANPATSTVVSQTSGTNTTRFMSKYKGTDANLLRVQLTPVVKTTLAATAIAYASSVVTVTVNNSLSVGDIVTISGATFAGYNTTVVELPVASASATQFTVAVAVSGSPSTSAATVTVYGDYWTLIVAKETVTNESPDTFSNDLVLETYNNVVFNNKQSSDYIGTILSLRSDYIKVDETTGTYDATKRPSYLNTGVNTPLVFTGGTDGSAPAATDYTGSNNAVLKEFDVLERPLVVFAPELANQLTDATAKTVFNGMTSWAESNGKAFVVADTASGNTVVNAISASNVLTASSYGAIYYPNYYVPDSKAQSANALRLVGPSSAVAGLMLATDRAVGPHKSAAGISAKLANAVALELNFTSSDLDSLNTATNPVNAIRNLPGAGIVVMGGRTLKSSSTITKYISTRRSLFYIKRQMEVLTQFALFENNSEILWSRLRTVLTAFLNEYRNQGGLRGTTIDQSFYIKCDAENNDATSIAAGIVNIEVGVALERPAEFIVIALSQMTTI